MKKDFPETIRGLISILTGLECWYVSCGGAARTTFQLSLGDKVPRSLELKNPRHSEEFRRFEGKVSVLVWCAWRLDASDGPVTSWDDAEPSVEEGLMKLVGSRIESVDILSLVWDVNFTFSNGFILRVFCDHVPGEPSFDGNWELRADNALCAFGPGIQYRIEKRPTV